MKAALRRIGNSKGLILPKPVLAQLAFEDEVDLTVERGALIARPVKKRLRVDWADASRAIAAEGDDGLIWPEFANADDGKLRW